MKQVTLDTIDTIEKMYLAQKDQEDLSGIDTTRDRARMSQWIQDVKDGNGGKEELDRRFPDVQEKHHMCPKCKGDGMFFTETARKRVTTRTGSEIRIVPGVVFCKCPAGQNKHAAVRAK